MQLDSRTACSVAHIGPFFSPRHPEGKHMLVAQVDPGKSPETENPPLYMEGRERLEKTQAALVWHLTAFFKGNLHRRHILGSSKMKWVVSALPTGAKELFYTVKRGEPSQVLVQECCLMWKLYSMLDQVQMSACSRNQLIAGGKRGVPPVCQSGHQLESESLRGLAVSHLCSGPGPFAVHAMVVLRSSLSTTRASAVPAFEFPTHFPVLSL